MRNRRGFLIRIVQGFTVTGLGIFTYPFVSAFLPSFENDLSLEVDISDLAPGKAKVVHWLGRNLFIQKRSRETLKALAQSNPALKDPKSEASSQPVFAKNPHRSLRPDIFVVYSNCTHLGCEVMTDSDGFNCPCHQSQFDAAGRVTNDAAAPINLEVPFYKFISGNSIRLLQVKS